MLLIDVPPAYHEAIATSVELLGATAVVLTGEVSLASVNRQFTLCVVAISGESEEKFERIRGYCKHLRPTPVVVLATNTGLEFAIRLVRLGVADVIEIPAPPLLVAEKCVQSLADSGQSPGDEVLVGESAATKEVLRRVER